MALQIILMHNLTTNIGDMDFNIRVNLCHLLIILPQEFVSFLVSLFHKCAF